MPAWRESRPAAPPRGRAPWECGRRTSKGRWTPRTMGRLAQWPLPALGPWCRWPLGHPCPDAPRSCR
eukprot:8223397-Alexandrium_andersonii.AAC.1